MFVVHPYVEASSCCLKRRLSVVRRDVGWSQTRKSRDLASAFETLNLGALLLLSGHRRPGSQQISARVKWVRRVGRREGYDQSHSSSQWLNRGECTYKRRILAGFELNGAERQNIVSQRHL